MKVVGTKKDRRAVDLMVPWRELNKAGRNIVRESVYLLKSFKILTPIMKFVQVPFLTLLLLESLVRAELPWPPPCSWLSEQLWPSCS